MVLTPIAAKIRLPFLLVMCAFMGIGEEANIFYYLTYEGAADLETMEDELQRAAIEDQIV
ncbi:hypothetical protein Lser_V15G36921 [Lactuca serriola]